MPAGGTCGYLLAPNPKCALEIRFLLKSQLRDKVENSVEAYRRTAYLAR